MASTNFSRSLFGACASFALLGCVEPPDSKKPDPPAKTAADVARAPAFELAPESKKTYEERVLPFLKRHCSECHDANAATAGFVLDSLKIDFLDGKTANQWREAVDLVSLGKMPKKRPQPDPKEAFAVVEWVNAEMRNAEKRAQGSGGRIPVRRLNRTEYVNTLRDLFYLDDNVARALEEELPMDGKVDGFDRGGAGLFIDEAQMAKYLEIADLVLGREVFAPKPKLLVKKYFARDIKLPYDGKFALMAAYPIDHLLMRERVKVPLGPNTIEFKNGGVEWFQGWRAGGDLIAGVGEVGAANWYGNSYEDPLKRNDMQDGWYRLKVRAGASKGAGAFAVDDVKLEFWYTPNTPIQAKESVVINASLDDPRDFEMMVFLRSGPPGLASKNYGLRWNGVRNAVIPNPVLHKLEEEYNRVIRLPAFTKRNSPQAEIDEAKRKVEDFSLHYHRSLLELKTALVYNPDVDLKSVPRLWVESFEIEGPIATWPPKGRTELLFAGESKAFDEPYIRQIFARFLPRAYRRPAEPSELDGLVKWVLNAQQVNNLSGVDAVREGVRAVLCSPKFLIIHEPTGKDDKPRKLTDYELACRLSYFLWSTMPDAELFQLAADNKLHEPKTLQAQVRRMIADPKGVGLVRNFTGQWLKVREFSSVITDRVQYKAYDDELQESSRREPYEFFKKVLQDDLSILNFLDSDFLVINERLARHYGIDGMKGNAFRPVAIRPEQRRGGVLGMAGVLTFLSDGQRTLPVRRAAYVLDTLWNAPPPPPPPNAGDLPPVKGKNLTVRQRLDQHRDSALCASCHARIDPFGMALENYDAIGAWRDRQNGERFKGDDKSPLLDVSGALPSGRKFENLQEYKQGLLAEKERFVRGFVEKMLTYALGRPVGATDGETVAEIIKALEPDEATDQEKYRLQALIQAIVFSRNFQMK
ncbi:hypothetical protein AYO44_11335 [Planctomycetaceae bacterium SCGC AG-212-F19]|nr:hypothetical protein AYO44_11335 [Planctomycetaceae bacterium SCGC AG-212-F19]